MNNYIVSSYRDVIVITKFASVNWKLIQKLMTGHLLFPMADVPIFELIMSSDIIMYLPDPMCKYST